MVVRPGEKPAKSWPRSVPIRPGDRRCQSGRDLGLTRVVGRRESSWFGANQTGSGLPTLHHHREKFTPYFESQGAGDIRA